MPGVRPLDNPHWKTEKKNTVRLAMRTQSPREDASGSVTSIRYSRNDSIPITQSVRWGTARYSMWIIRCIYLSMNKGVCWSWTVLAPSFLLLS